MNDDKKLWICKFPMKKGTLDDDYIFYESGKIVHEYDRTRNDVNKEETVNPENLPLVLKESILEKCPEAFKERIAIMLKI